MALLLFCKCLLFFFFFVLTTLHIIAIAAPSAVGPVPVASPVVEPGENGPLPDPSPEHSPQVIPESPPSPPPVESPSVSSPAPTLPPGPEMLPSNAPSPSTSRSAPSPASAEPPEAQSGLPEAGTDSTFTVTWCAVRDELADCQYYLSLLNTEEYKWSCIQKQSAAECMEAIKAKEADLISLDAGLAYVAFLNYSMKAIMSEEYCYHKKSYDAVAVVSKASCDENSKLSLGDFRGSRSCHPGYRTAAGWNSPVYFLVKTGLQRSILESSLQSDEAVVRAFFSETCAPSELDSGGLCTSCGNNGSCDASVSNVYRGYPGAFRCLLEELGDIAFLRSDTAQRLSSDGLNAQNWSTKSVNDFMYLCPDGGCRPINDNVAGCSFASVSSDVIMTFNSQTNDRRDAIVKTLLNASWTDALYSGKNWEEHLLSASTQNLVEVTELTRAYLGEAATVAQSIETLQYVNVSSLPSKAFQHQTSGISCLTVIASLVITILYSGA